MNFIHSEKTVWILPERTATRTIGQLLNFWEVQIFEGDRYKTCVPHKNMNGEFSQGLRPAFSLLPRASAWLNPPGMSLV